MKSGPGILISQNGDIFASCRMFVEDEYFNCRKVSIDPSIYEKIRKIFNCKVYSTETFYKRVHELYKHSNTIGPYSPFLTLQLDVDLRTPFMVLFLSKHNIDIDKGLKAIKDEISRNYLEIKLVYEKYATFADLSIQFKNKNLMNRLTMWQFMRDMGLDSPCKLQS